jgi:hypothetical protein
MLKWLSQFPKSGLAYLIFGRHGCGKTHLINLVCKELNYEILEVNCNNVSLGRVENYLKNSILNKKKSVVLFDDLNVILKVQGKRRKKKKTKDLILQGIKKKRKPIIITTIKKPWDDTKTFEKMCIVEKIWSPSKDKIYEVIEEKHPNLEAKFIRRISRSAEGDLNFALNNIGKKSVKKTNNESQSVFEAYKNLPLLNDNQVLNDFYHFKTYNNKPILPHFLFQNYCSQVNETSKKILIPVKKHEFEDNGSIKVEEIIEKGIPSKLNTITNISNLISKGDTIINNSLYYAYYSMIIPLKDMNLTSFVQFPESLKGKKVREMIKLYENGCRYMGGVEGLKLIINQAIKGDFKSIRIFETADDFKYWANKLESKKWKKVTRKTKLKINRIWKKKKSELYKKTIKKRKKLHFK